MKLPRLRTILLAPLVLFALLYLFGAMMLAMRDDELPAMVSAAAEHRTIAIFGASGTAGDGILKAALDDPSVDTIRVITRRITPRMEKGVAAGKVEVATHLNYLDYEAIHDQLADADAVFWAIGLSSIGVDEKIYRRIHVDFPVQFVKEWADISQKTDISFHYISSSDISKDSSAMWAREKLRAENMLFEFAEGTSLRVIAYRPDYIGPTAEEATIGQKMLYWFFRPVGAAVRATEIGGAMLEITARGSEFENGDKIGTWNIRRYSDAHARRMAGAGP